MEGWVGGCQAGDKMMVCATAPPRPTANAHSDYQQWIIDGRASLRGGWYRCCALDNLFGNWGFRFQDHVCTVHQRMHLTGQGMMIMIYLQWDFFAGFCEGKKSRCVFVVVRFMGDLESAEEKGGFLSRENREWLNLDMW